MKFKINQYEGKAESDCGRYLIWKTKGDPPYALYRELEPEHPDYQALTSQTQGVPPHCRYLVAGKYMDCVNKAFELEGLPKPDRDQAGLTDLDRRNEGKAYLKQAKELLK